MAPHIALPFAAIMLVAAPGPAPAPAPALNIAAPPAPETAPQQQPQQATDPQILAIDLGHVVGAAAQCTTIDKSRISSATAKAKALVASAAHTQGPDADAVRRFDDGVADGQDAVVSGETNCTSAEAGLRQLEQQAPPK